MLMDYLFSGEPAIVILGAVLLKPLLKNSHELINHREGESM